MNPDFLVSLAKGSSIEPISGLIFGEETLEIGGMAEKRQKPIRNA
jgi:hypothetical protein